MEDDDEFGDLYTDVLRPLTASHPPHPVSTLQSRPIDQDTDSDDEEILHGAADLKISVSGSRLDPVLKSNTSVQEISLTKPEARPELGGFNWKFDSTSKAAEVAGCDGLGLEAGKEPSGGFNFTEDEDDLNIVVEERENKDDDLVEKDVNLVHKQEKKMHSSTEQRENAGSFGESAPDQMIPGLSANFDSHVGPNFEDDWESDESDDDLQIVLNDSHHGPMGMERMPGMNDEDDDEDGDQLIIVADNGDVVHHSQPMLEERELGVEEGGPTADGDRKESGDAAKAGGSQQKVGYSNQLYHHHPFHSQFKANGISPDLKSKYVRPGAEPLPGGTQSQVCPPVAVGPGAGRGRGEWRPRGPVPMQKGLHPGYGIPGWGHSTAGRGYGSGLDFTLPSHKTIFEVDIDGFEEKPWRLPGIDMSDFFNFGLNEEGWKDYCKQLEQLRLETTMQSKIRVYESGRMEQDYDPDLPPELAAAVGNPEIPSENRNAGTGEAGPSDLARSSAHAQPPIKNSLSLSQRHKGKAGHSKPARPRGIKRSFPKDSQFSGKRNLRRELWRESTSWLLPVGRPIPVETGSGDRLPSIDTRRPRMHDSDAIIEVVCQSSNDDGDVAEQQDNDVVGGVDDIDVVQEDGAGHIDRSSPAYKGQKRENVARREQLVSRDEIGKEGDPHEERYTSGKRQVGPSSDTNPSDDDDDGAKQVTGNQNESFDSENVKQNPSFSSDDEEPAVDIEDTNGDFAMDDERSLDIERENDERENSKCEGRVRSRHGEDNRKIHESKVLEEDHHSRPRQGSSFKRRAEEDEEREDSRRHSRGDSWRKRGTVHDRDVELGQRPRPRERDNLVKSQTEKVDEAHGKRRKDGRGIEREEKAYNHNRESSRRKRERERDDAQAKSKNGDTHYTARQKEATRQITNGAPRGLEEKKWISHSRGKDEYKRSGRDYHSRNVGHQIKKRDRAEDDSFSRSRGREEANARGNRQGSKDEKRAAYERPDMSDEYNRQKVGSRKSKELESGDRGSLIPSEGNHDDKQSGQMSEMVESRAKTKQSNPETSKKHGEEEASSDEEQQSSSRRGRSKFERWTSHQERDPSISSSSFRKTNKDSDTQNSGSISLIPLKAESNNKPESSVDNKDSSAKPIVDDNNNNNKHMDTVEKLKKRSERFKLPMPSGKEAVAVKKMESEPLPSSQTEVCPDLEIKPERPARKRRWTGN
ncbi:homolog of yeast FIP1 [Striga asiatica]|uniref:Homolog of yeast FIP1 n=1 Tax=Striga asiatica TaxID=4170 RepID=A0A5A7QI36_STRAF|nr:homolog of yeast FIP1 [Striga asiatica]